MKPVSYAVRQENVQDTIPWIRRVARYYGDETERLEFMDADAAQAFARHLNTASMCFRVVAVGLDGNGAEIGVIGEQGEDQDVQAQLRQMREDIDGIKREIALWLDCDPS